jgi:two-component system, NtrC family, response regulator AtoC
MNILVIDDEPDICQSLAGFLNRLGHSVTCAQNGAEGLKLYHQHDFQLIITDVRMPVMDGLELLKRIKTIERAAVDVIVFTGHGDMDNAIKALQYGAFDYLQKPVNVRELAIAIDRSAEYAALRKNYLLLKNDFKNQVDKEIHICQGEAERLRQAYLDEIGLNKLYVFSDGMRRILSQAEKYSSDRSVSVLIEGESGTGKELIARYIHHFNPKSHLTPFVPINCGALSESLIEDELFGHESGAFTGATKHGRKGKLEAASGGTLFLDEIGEMSISLQIKLLRVLEDRHIYRLGGIKEIPIDIRVICATNKNLQDEVTKGNFRLDLFYRIGVGSIKIPPLRQRPESILPFAIRFAERAFKRQGKQFEKFSPEAETFLKKNSWPGNVRQIKNTMERIALLKSDGFIDIPDLSFVESGDQKIVPEDASEVLRPTDDMELPDNFFNIESFNRSITKRALEKFSGNQSKTSEYLCISRRQLQGRIKKWNLS